MKLLRISILFLLTLSLFGSCSMIEKQVEEQRIAYYSEELDAIVEDAEESAEVKLGKIEALLAKMSDEKSGLKHESELKNTLYAYCHLNQGRYNDELGNSDLALEFMNIAINEQLDPETNFFYWRGMVYSKMNNTEKALTDLSESIKTDTGGRALLARGEVYEKMGKKELAEKDYTNGIEIATENAIAFDGCMALGNLYMYSKEWNKAMLAFDGAMHLRESDVTLCQRRGEIRIACDQLEFAVKEYSRGISFNPNNASLHYERGKTYFKLKNWVLARVDLTRAISLDNDDSSQLHISASSYLNQIKK